MLKEEIEKALAEELQSLTYSEKLLIRRALDCYLENRELTVAAKQDVSRLSFLIKDNKFYFLES